MKKFFILDGNALLHRAWHAIPPLTTNDGLVVNAVYGFANVIEKLREQYKPDYFAVAWDLPGGTFRHEAFDEYKAHRKKKEPELYAQIPMIKEMLEFYGIKSIEKEGLEADDLIGVLSKKVASEDIKVTIITGDYDSLQLVDDNIEVLAFIRGVSKTKVFGRKEVKEKFGIWPEQMIDYKAMAGDSSDNIPGFKGIGAKTAVKLLDEYKSLDGVFKALHDDLLPKKMIKYFEGKEEYAEKMKFLVTILTENGVEYDYNDFEQKGVDAEGLVNLFEKYEFRTLIAKYSNEMKKGDNENVVKSDEIKNDEKKYSFESEYIYLFEFEEELYLWDGEVKKGKEIERVIIDTKKEVVLFDGKNIKHKFGILPEKFFDVKLAAYVCASHLRDFVFNALCKHFLNENEGENIDIVLRQFEEIYLIVKEQLQEGRLEYIAKEIEFPLIKVLQKMEEVGIGLDIDNLADLAKKTDELIDDLVKEVCGLAGKEFNLNSTQQLAVVLFEDLGLPTKKIKKTKTGFSTAASELEKLWEEHEIIPKISEYRELAKMKSTYIDALPKLVAEDGRLHTNYNQTGTSTGRLSSNDPNLQNIPIRSELGMKIRRAFVAEKGYKFLAADYSQIELRIVTEISGDESFKKAFMDGADIHLRTAALMLEKDEKEISKDERRSAKAINFGILYGMGSRALARSANLDQKTAKEYIERYFKIHPGIEDYMDRMKKLVREQGYIETIYGRRRYFPEINSRIPMMIAQAERMAINFPAQGSQADLLKLAMIEINRLIEEDELPVRMLLQVHDELVFEVRDDFVDEFAKIVKEEMIRVWKGDISLIVNCSIGDNWADLVEID